MCRSFYPFLSHILNSCRLDGCSTSCSQYAANIEASYLRFLKCCLPRDEGSGLFNFFLGYPLPQEPHQKWYSQCGTLIPSLTASSFRLALRAFPSRVDHCSLYEIKHQYFSWFCSHSSFSVIGSLRSRWYSRCNRSNPFVFQNWRRQVLKGDRTGKGAH